MSLVKKPKLTCRKKIRGSNINIKGKRNDNAKGKRKASVKNRNSEIQMGAINLHAQGEESCEKKEGKRKVFIRNPPPINSSPKPKRTVIIIIIIIIIISCARIAAYLRTNQYLLIDQT